MVFEPQEKFDKMFQKVHALQSGNGVVSVKLFKNQAIINYLTMLSLDMELFERLLLCTE